jgi:hypothetical protein
MLRFNASHCAVLSKEERTVMKKYLGLATLLVTILFMQAANAVPIFVGSWDVADTNAPYWDDYPPNGPLAYTAQEAAALLFGGSPGDYAISTIDDQIANINNMAWYDVIGLGGVVFAEDYSNKYLGQFYGPTEGFDFGNPNNPASAYVRDNLFDGSAINFAFRKDTSAVPEPAVLSLLVPGMLGMVAMRRRRGKVATA